MISLFSKYSLTLVKLYDIFSITLKYIEDNSTNLIELLYQMSLCMLKKINKTLEHINARK